MNCSVSKCSSKMFLSVDVYNRSCHPFCLRDGLEISVNDLSVNFTASKQKPEGNRSFFSDSHSEEDNFDDLFDVFIDRVCIYFEYLKKNCGFINEFFA